MASPQLLNAAIRRDGAVQEASYTLLCMVLAVEKANAVSKQGAGDVLAVYLSERDVSPFECVLQAANDFSLQKKLAKKDKNKRKHEENNQDGEEGETTPQANSVHAQVDLKRLLRSTSRVETRLRLEEQLESLRLAQIHELTGVSLPEHLQITTLEEDPLEFRRDTRGVAQVWGRNVLGEHYAPKDDRLRFLRNYSVPELFKRMKRAVREDLSTRNKRRIAALNAKARERNKELEQQGILSPEQQLEAKFDQLLNASAAASSLNAQSVRLTFADHDGGHWHWDRDRDLTITCVYLFQGRLPLPLVEFAQSGDSYVAVVKVTAPKENLRLSVVQATFEAEKKGKLKAYFQGFLLAPFD